MNPVTRRGFLSQLGAFGAAMALPRAIWSAGGGRKLNFVFILIDDMGWTDVGCFGSRYHETPNIDRLAAEGMKFTSGYAACPVCSPTRASVMTGQYPARLHLTDFLVGTRWPKDSPIQPLKKWQTFLPVETPTLPRLLKSAGYVTGHIGKWHLGEKNEVEEYGFDVNVAGGKWGSPPSYFSPYKNSKLKDGPEGEYLTDRLTAEAEQFMEQNKDRPFFLQLAHYAVHIPLKAKPELVKKYEAKAKPEGRVTNAVYAAMTESVDQCVGRVMRKLEELGIADRTVVIFTSDNGGLSVKEGPAIPTSNLPLRAGKGYLYEGGIRVPWIVKWPGVTKAGSVSDESISSVDVLPTLLEMAGASGLSPRSCDGQSMVAAMKGGRMRREAIFWHYPHYSNQGGKPGGAVRAGDWKLIEWYEDGKVELYNLREDVGETRDLSAQLPEKAAELKKMLGDWRKGVDAQMPARRGMGESQAAVVDEAPWAWGE